MLGKGVSGSAIASARPDVISGFSGGHGQCLRPVVLILLLVDARKFFFFFFCFSFVIAAVSGYMYMYLP
jgi:hypothetical protein